MKVRSGKRAGLFYLSDYVTIKKVGLRWNKEVRPASKKKHIKKEYLLQVS
jgi:hypothetical protein